ncbi:MAG TPA: glucosaminidase domain-containing protein [Panacibacter sp.]|nr:glucosaminidase domain-containing protein [Panacibacter sp.]
MKRLFFAFLIITAFTRPVFSQTTEATRQYIDTYKQLAINEEIRTGIPASITLAQGILESQSGLSKLSTEANNHFGIKCKAEWIGDTYNYDDDLKQECFRRYPTAEDSYRDHSDFLKNRPNYASLFTLDPVNCEDWAHGLKKAGYATNPAYARMLLKIINDNNLQQYTFIALQHIKDGTREDVAANNSTINKNTVTINKPEPVEAIKPEPENILPPQTETVYEPGNYPAGIFTINQAKVIYAAAGSSLFALANNNNIAYSKLLEFNNLDQADILSNDQLIFLEKKPKKSNNRDYHIVAPSETIEYIAQIEGVQLESIFGYNKMQKGLQPAAGEKVYLRPGTYSYYPKLARYNSSK